MQKRLLSLDQRAEMSRNRDPNEEPQASSILVKTEKIVLVNGNAEITCISGSKTSTTTPSKGDSVALVDVLDEETSFPATLLSVDRDKIVLLSTDPLISVRLACDRDYELSKTENYRTYEIMNYALDNLGKIESPLRDVLFGEDSGERLDPPRKITFFNDDLNAVQREAVELALAQPHLGVICGPPGTGKSTVVLEIVAQLVASPDSRVLVCTPSNVAIDDLLSRFVRTSRLPVARVGNPARMAPPSRPHSLSAQIDDPSLGLSWKRLLGAVGGDKLDGLLREYRQLERRLQLQVLQKSRIVFSTLAGVYSLLQLPDLMFDVVLIDESAQALEPLCLLPLKIARKYILAGDHRQLGPVIHSASAAHQGLGVSMMQNLSSLHPAKTITLTIQYRMNLQIMEFPSRQFYSGRLVADDLAASRSLNGVSGIGQNLLTESRVVLVDSSAMAEGGGVSKFNLGEARTVGDCVGLLLGSGVPARFIGVITFYSQQVSALRRVLRGVPQVEVDSVDAFQGREKEIIIVSFVRSNPSNTIGFLGDERRINVALTRARRLLVLVMNCGTMGGSGNEHVRSMVRHFGEKAVNLIPADVRGPGRGEGRRTREPNGRGSVERALIGVAARRGEFVYRGELSSEERRVVVEVAEGFATLGHSLCAETGDLRVFGLRDFVDEDVLVDCLTHFGIGEGDRSLGDFDVCEFLQCGSASQLFCDVCYSFLCFAHFPNHACGGY